MTAPDMLHCLRVQSQKGTFNASKRCRPANVDRGRKIKPATDMLRTYMSGNEVYVLGGGKRAERSLAVALEALD